MIVSVCVWFFFFFFVLDGNLNCVVGFDEEIYGAIQDAGENEINMIEFLYNYNQNENAA